MNHLTYLGLDISTNFTDGQDYLELRGQVRIMDDQTGQEKTVGKITATVLSEQWSEVKLVSIAAGIDERLHSCLKCLEEYDLFVGKVAVILESEFIGEFKRYEEQAFRDLTYFLDRALQVDHTITSFPFERQLKKELGYQRTWGPDKRSYSIRTTREFEPCIPDVSIVPFDYQTKQVGPIYNRLRTNFDPSSVLSLSDEARKVISILETNRGRALNKADILKECPFSEDELSLAMLELIEIDLIIEESAEQQLSCDPKSSEECTAAITELSILGDVKTGNVARVAELIESGADINELTAEGWNALFIAIDNKDNEMAKLLLQKGIDANYESIDGTTALKFSWRTQNRIIEQILTQYGVTMRFE